MNEEQQQLVFRLNSIVTGSGPYANSRVILEGVIGALFL